MDFYEVIDTITCESYPIEQLILKALRDDGIEAIIREIDENNKIVIKILNKE